MAWMWQDVLSPTFYLTDEDPQRTIHTIHSLTKRGMHPTLVDSAGKTLLYTVATSYSFWGSRRSDVIMAVFNHPDGVNLACIEGSGWLPLLVVLEAAEKTAWVPITERYMEKGGPLDNPEALHILVELAFLQKLTALPENDANLMAVFDLLIPKVGGYPMRGHRHFHMNPVYRRKILEAMEGWNLRWSPTRASWIRAVAISSAVEGVV